MALSKGVKIGGSIIIVIVLAMVGMAFLDNQPGQYDDFAKCITAAGAVEYGAYWCPHCQEQKNMFGNSFDHVNYVECSLPNRGGQTPACAQAGITGYPTWEFADGERLSGKQSFETLAQKTGCTV